MKGLFPNSKKFKNFVLSRDKQYLTKTFKNRREYVRSFKIFARVSRVCTGYLLLFLNRFNHFGCISLQFMTGKSDCTKLQSQSSFDSLIRVCAFSLKKRRLKKICPSISCVILCLILARKLNFPLSNYPAINYAP